jgi:hypothetical protein
MRMEFKQPIHLRLIAQVCYVLLHAGEIDVNCVVVTPTRAIGRLLTLNFFTPRICGFKSCQEHEKGLFLAY